MKSINLKEILSNKIVKMFLIFIIVIIVIIVGVSIFFVIKGTRVKSYSRLEEVIVNAGRNYYNVHQEQLPIEIGTVSSVDHTTLSTEKFMKELINIEPKGANCSAKAIVKNVNGNYMYYADLDCGENYKTESLTDVILKSTPVVTAGDGLYENNGDYVYRGEKPNNYINFANRLYRIISINSDKSITIIAATYNKDLFSVSWDDRYNIDKDYNTGINDYSISRMKESLNAYVNDSNNFSDNDRLKMVYHNLCIGRVGHNDALSRNIECSQTYDNQIIGLLPVSNYVYASIDPNCKSAYDESCQNYNYLSEFGQNWWTITPIIDNSYQAYLVGSSGVVNTQNCYSYGRIRDVIKLTDLLQFNGGTGTFDDPFVIK